MPLPILAIGLGVLGVSVIYKAVEASGKLQDNKKKHMEDFKNTIIEEAKNISNSDISKKKKKTSFNVLINLINDKQDILNKEILDYEVSEVLKKREDILFRYKHTEQSVLELVELYIKTYNKLPF